MAVANMMNTEVFGGMLKQANETFQQSMSTGVKFQEETTKFWNNAFGKAFDGFQSQAGKFSDEVVPGFQKNVDEFHRTFEKQTQESLDTLRRTFEQNQKVMNQDVFNQTFDLWRTSFDTMRTSVDRMTQANMNMFESWTGMVKDNVAQTSKGNGKPAGK